MNDQAQSIFSRGRSFLSEVLRMAQTRLELLALEVEQEKLQVSRDLRLALIAAVCAWLAGFTLVLWVALTLSPGVRFIVLGALFGVFVLAALACWIRLRRSMRRAPLFSRLIGQLRLDRASLGGDS